MTPTRTDPPPGGGDTLLGLMAFAVLLASGAIAGLGILGSWWLLPVVMVSLIGLAVGVAYALVHLMDEDDLRAPQLPVREPAARPEPAPRPRVVAGH